ncbi:extensin family protein [Rhizobiaceae bacterium n13]|uniref:Extensin family protein n=1 Tax=Ferirhizobium litorale TaxID=2927786 RepID=A0AAE3U061_9HYPH|nr:extensin family protein [Fererhizobium litorale]MDI7860833.1 extensin family protein [Fererhizobium litorale]MDI7920981.1 extensin family protein [Fererhizobium litorale]
MTASTILVAITGGTVLLAATDLPLVGPLPDPKPAPATQPGKIPVPEPAPSTSPEAGSDAAKAEPPPPIEKEDPARYAACLASLREMGVLFQEKPRIDGGEGCGIDKPISVSEAGGGIKLRPAATLGCGAALRLARWTRDIVVPMARIAFPDKRVLALENASSYVCRLRNNASVGKISEHARGTAIDISSIILSEKLTVTMQPRNGDSTIEGAFQRSVTTAACLYFTTVLSPGSDAAHQDHLHLDGLERSNGYRYCR